MIALHQKSIPSHIKKSNSAYLNEKVMTYQKQQTFKHSKQNNSANQLTNSQLKDNKKNCYHILKQQQNQFSFNFNNMNQVKGDDLNGINSKYSSQKSINSNSLSIASLRENLITLQKNQIIEILIEEIMQKNVQKSKSNIKNDVQSQEIKKLDKLNSFECKRKRQEKQSLMDKKYNDLVQYFEQYIQNTNQAQTHFLKRIADLKTQNENLKAKFYYKQSFNHDFQQKKKQKALSQQKQSQKERIYKLQIEKLQNTIQNYIKINNELTIKLQRIQKINEDLNTQNIQIKKRNDSDKNHHQIIKTPSKMFSSNQKSQNILEEKNINIINRNIESKSNSKKCIKLFSQSQQEKENEKNDQSSKKKKSCLYQSQKNSNFSNGIVSSIRNNDSIQNYSNFQSQIRQISQTNLANNLNQNQYLLNTIKVLQINNKEMKSINNKLEKIVQNKSEKIRKLLEDLQKITEQKLQFKEQYMMSMCKLRQYQLLKQSSLSKSTHCNQNNVAINQQDQNIKNLSPHFNINKNNIQEKIRTQELKNQKTSRSNQNRSQNTKPKYNEEDLISLVCQSQALSRINQTYIYASQRQFQQQKKQSQNCYKKIISGQIQNYKLSNSSSMQALNKSLEHQNKSQSLHKFNDEIKVNMKKNKNQKINFYQISKENFKLS